MLATNSLFSYFTDAGAVVKFVMFLLLAASLVSWTLIFQRGLLLAKARKTMEKFQEKFWSGIDLAKLYTETSGRMHDISGLEHIFVAGFKEFIRLRKQTAAKPTEVLEGAQRAMRIANARELDNIEQHLALLATIGSTSPYVGLFGTVWGIMTSFQALGNVQQATISLVAPGISEALIATAMGLFAAIPAVIAYNRYNNDIERLQNRYETFQEEFSTILQRQTFVNQAHEKE